MRRLVFAVCFAVVSTATPAVSSEHRAATTTQQHPSPVSALLKWLSDKAKPDPAVHPAAHATPAVHPTVAAHFTVHVAVRSVRRHERPERPAAPTMTTAAAPVPPPAAAPAVAAAPIPLPVAAPAAAAPIAPLAAAITAVEPAAPPAAVPAAPPAATLVSLPAAPAEPTDPIVPRAVATISVSPPSPKIPKSASHGCDGGERIITAFYWEGTHTASGVRFDPNGMTAAHRTLPFGTRLLVTNPRTGKSVTVTINDRGPFVRGVTLDLSRGAAKAIGMSGTGAVCMAKL
jgi:rare lipoprotein A